MTAQLGGQEPPQEARLWLGDLIAEKRDECPRTYDDMDSWDLATVVLAALRDALAKGGHEGEQVAAALGLTVEDQWPVERRLLVEHNGHEHEYSHMCPACNPLEGEFELIRRRRVVGPWVEVSP